MLLLILHFPLQCCLFYCTDADCFFSPVFISTIRFSSSSSSFFILCFSLSSFIYSSFFFTSSVFSLRPSICFDVFRLLILCVHVAKCCSKDWALLKIEYVRTCGSFFFAHSYILSFFNSLLSSWDRCVFWYHLYLGSDFLLKTWQMSVILTAHFVVVFVARAPIIPSPFYRDTKKWMEKLVMCVHFIGFPFNSLFCWICLVAFRCELETAFVGEKRLASS